MALGEVCFHSPGGFISNPPAETQRLICMKGKESLLRSPFNLEGKEKKLSAQCISCFISKLFHYTLKSCFCGGHKWKCAQQREKKWYGVTKSIFKSHIFFILHNGYKTKNKNTGMKRKATYCSLCSTNSDMHSQKGEKGQTETNSIQ